MGRTAAKETRRERETPAERVEREDRMLLAEEDGKRLSQDQVVVTTMTFLTAGFESTNNLFTNLTAALSNHPAIFAWVRRRR